MSEGQWTGSFAGTNNGLAVLDAEREGANIVGNLYAFDNGGLPNALMPVSFPVGNTKHRLAAPLIWLHPTQAKVLTPEEVEQLRARVNLPATATVSMSVGPRVLKADWHTPAGTRGTARLVRSSAERPSKLTPERGIRTWDQFKNMAADLEPDRFIFRGQNRPTRLRTAFHRTPKKDLVKYITDYIPPLHRTLTARTRHFFDLRDGPQNGAFLNLIQHHGFPTPLLDWTYSPFVAAHFAFGQGFMPRDTTEPKVRILMFDRKEWKLRYNQLQQMAFCRPHFSILEALALENERALPQQALSTVSNVDDIETYIQDREREQNFRFLKAFDLLRSETPKVHRELRLMGITEASLFPGLDGACREMRQRFFS